MNTSKVPALLPNIKLEEDRLKDGSIRFLGHGENFDIEIIPDRSVSFLVTKIDKEILSVLDSYTGDTKLSISLLERAAKAVAENPNQRFRENISGDLFLIYAKIASADGAVLHLGITEG